MWKLLWNMSLAYLYHCMFWWTKKPSELIFGTKFEICSAKSMVILTFYFWTDEKSKSILLFQVKILMEVELKIYFEVWCGPPFSIGTKEKELVKQMQTTKKFFNSNVFFRQKKFKRAFKRRPYRHTSRIANQLTQTSISQWARKV